MPYEFHKAQHKAITLRPLKHRTQPTNPYWYY